jgi:DNA helicase II / ATP-dependent DNA helicase PcrA
VTADLLQGLNPQQRQAVLHGEGPLLVFAGAGSGKTRVITHRIAYLVRACGVRPWQILAVTFTNKAAGEMRNRVGALLGGGDALRETWIGTFHATCARLLRQHPAQSGLARDFVIYDDADQRTVVTRVARELNLDERSFPARMLQARISKAKQACIAADEFQPADWVEDQVAKVYRLYEQRMAAASAVDFDDLLFRVVRLLEKEEAVAESLRRRFQHLLVDEFQDTNHVQYRLLKLLTGPTRNIAVVGDDDQSIYRWRGADVRNILGFRRDYPDALVVTLEQNYRSTGNILAGAVAVIRRNRTRAPKTLWTENAAGDPISVATVGDERDEASHVVQRIRAELEGGREAGDFAVFYRINAQARVLEEALREARIPYRVYGGMEFYKRAEIRDVFAYLRVVHNPADDVDLARIINTPPRKIGATTVARLHEEATRRGVSLFDAIRAVRSDEAWGAAGRRLGEFADLILELRELVGHAGPVELACTVIERTKYSEWLKAQESAEAEDRLGNLDELIGSFQDFEQRSEDTSLAALLEQYSLVQDTDSMEESPQTVTLMTVHSAKGLEFPVVFLTGMEEDIFPYRRANDEADDRERQEQLEEERRLCYVAFTRARQRLVLTNVVRRRLFGSERFNMPSRFLDDLPPELVAAAGARVDRQRGLAAALAAPRRGPGDLGRVERPHAPEAFEEVGEGIELRPGMRVSHAKFGVGRVHRVEAGFPPKVVIDFPDHGRKTIIATAIKPVL